MVRLPVIGALVAHHAAAFNGTVYTGGNPDDGGNRSSYGSTNRSGVSSSGNLTAPNAIQGVPYANQDLHNVGEFAGNVSDTDVWTDAEMNASLSAITDTTFSAAEYSTDSCSSQGFKCEFPASWKNNTASGGMGVYEPENFAWKVVDPEDFDVQDAYMKRTLSCTIDLAKPSGAPSDNRFFYIKTGRENALGANATNADYCDIEAIRRTVTTNGSSLSGNEMYDEIRVRGETARLDRQTNGVQSNVDLIGEFFDLTCRCTTNLDVEASVSLQHVDSQALITTMEGTDQERDLPISMHLFTNSSLLKEVRYDQSEMFPREEQFFFFVTKHTNAEDWDVQLQITKCGACKNNDASCTTRTASPNVVLFWENCGVLLGGPQTKDEDANSWYKVSTTAGPSGFENRLNPDGSRQWADADKTTCPYDSLGIQKFRLAGQDTMTVVCQVQGCVYRPCNPCAGYDTNKYWIKDTKPGETATYARSLFVDQESRRSLQAGQSLGASELGVSFRLGADDSADGQTLANQDDSSNSRSSKGLNILMIILVLLAAILAVGQVSRMMKNQKATQQKREVAPAATA